MIDCAERFDPAVLNLIPHRPPMLLINHLRSVSSDASSAVVLIDSQTPFHQLGRGVPSWIGLEYMGQTAALIAGHQLELGQIESHVGFLIGSRHYTATTEYFRDQSRLLVNCHQLALVGDSLATFECTIDDLENQQQLAHANLSVFRKPNPDSTQASNVE